MFSTVRKNGIIIQSRFIWTHYEFIMNWHCDYHYKHTVHGIRLAKYYLLTPGHHSSDLMVPVVHESTRVAKQQHPGGLSVRELETCGSNYHGNTRNRLVYPMIKNLARRWACLRTSCLFAIRVIKYCVQRMAASKKDEKKRDKSIPVTIHMCKYTIHTNSRNPRLIDSGKRNFSNMSRNSGWHAIHTHQNSNANPRLVPQANSTAFLHGIVLIWTDRYFYETKCGIYLQRSIETIRVQKSMHFVSGINTM